jgi:hypothetical protein
MSMPSTSARADSSATAAALRSLVPRIPATAVSPARASASTVSRPNPLEAPVIKAIW